MNKRSLKIGILLFSILFLLGVSFVSGINIHINKSRINLDIKLDQIDEEVKTTGQILSNQKEPIKDSPEIQWWYDLNAPSLGSAAVDDIDGDDYLEIVFGTYFNDEHIYALNAEDGSLLWNYDTGGCNDASPAIADVDLDGELEVIIPSSSPYTVYCFNGSTGDVKWSTSTGYPNCIDSPPCIADVDNDDKPEVILGAWYGYVFCLNGEDGSICWQTNIGSDSYIQSGPNILDLDADGQLDVVVAQYSGDCRIYALKGDDGSILWFSDVPQDDMYHGGSFADIDEDGKPEIAIGCYDNHVYVVNGEDGSLEWDYLAPYYIASPTSIADLNNDDHFEIIFTSYNILGVLSYTGDLIWSYTAGGSMFRGASISDVDGDGTLDVIFGSDDGILRALSGDNGQIVWTYDLEDDYGMTYNIDHAPVIADFNEDGKLDVFIIGGYATSSPPTDNHGRAYVLSAGNGTGNGWPMFRYDLLHSACFQNQISPIAVDDYSHTLENTSVLINITNNDYDIDGSIEPGTVEIINYPSNGSILVDQVSGETTYTPNLGFIGYDNFQYTVEDNDGLTSNVANVYITIITSDMIYNEILLLTGWNQITIPAENSLYNNASNIGEIINGCTQVSYWNNTLGAYQDWLVDFPDPEDDYPIKSGQSYFVFVNIDSSLPVYGQPIISVSVPLGVGWNMIGWYNTSYTMASSIGENITGCTQVSYWNNTLGAYQDWLVDFPDPEDDYAIHQGMGFFVYTDESSTWYGEG
jgi:outer membrane protein assembly factor BamB